MVFWAPLFMIHRWLAFFCFPLILGAQGSVAIKGKSYSYTANPRIGCDSPSGPAGAFDALVDAGDGGEIAGISRFSQEIPVTLFVRDSATAPDTGTQG